MGNCLSWPRSMREGDEDERESEYRGCFRAYYLDVNMNAGPTDAVTWVKINKRSPQSPLWPTRASF